MAYFADDLVSNHAEIAVGDKKVWVIARPVCGSFLRRLKDAWLVIVGKADAVRFHGQ